MSNCNCNEQNSVNRIESGTVVYPENCPESSSMTLANCDESFIANVGDTYMESMGRIMTVETRVRNVCPNKRVALAVILTEEDLEGNEYPRGMKTVTIPEHHYSTCRDVTVRGIKFVLPEDINMSEDGTFCGERSIRVKTIAHHIDNDFTCIEG